MSADCVVCIICHERVFKRKTLMLENGRACRHHDETKKADKKRRELTHKICNEKQNLHLSPSISGRFNTLNGCSLDELTNRFIKSLPIHHSKCTVCGRQTKSEYRLAPSTNFSVEANFYCTCGNSWGYAMKHRTIIGDVVQQYITFLKENGIKI